MDDFVLDALKVFCKNDEIFGPLSVFVRFETESTSVGPLLEDSFNSDLIFGRIVYRSRSQDEEKFSPPLLLKIFPRDFENKDFVTVQFFNEIAFYTRAVPLFQQFGDVQQLLPKFYESWASPTAAPDQPDHFALIFENLKSRGYRMADRYAFLDVHHLSLMARKLGHLHSFSHRVKSQQPREFVSLARWFRDSHQAIEEVLPNRWSKYAERGLRLLRQDSRYSNRLATAEKIVPNSGQFILQVNNVEPTDAMSVLCHGDYLRGNILFLYENGRPVDMKMVDFGACRVGSPAVDLSLMLYLNADQETRNLHWDMLVDCYYQGLCELFGGDQMPSKERILQEFCTKAFYNYFVASFFLPFTISKDKGTEKIIELVLKELDEEHEGNEAKGDDQNFFWNSSEGAELTEAVADVLRDMIDRNFI